MTRLIMYILLAVAGIGITASCSRLEKERIPDSTPDGKVRMELQLQLASQEPVSTKAANPEKELSEDVYVLVLDGNQPTSKLKQKPARAVETQGTTIYAVLAEEETPSYLYVLSSNMPMVAKEYLESAVSGVTLEELQQHLTLNQATESGLASPLPMSGLSGKIDQIKKGTSYSASVQLVRAVARIDAEVSETVTNFILTGMVLVNGAKNGWLIPPAKVIAQSDASTIQYGMVTPQLGEDHILGKIYCYENSGQSGQFTINPTRVVLRGKYDGASTDTYYGINLAYITNPDKPDEFSYHIDRNKQYTVSINKVQKSGYASLEEAVNNPEFNMLIEAEITVTDPYAHDITTNGKQYLGATNSDFLIHPNRDDTPVIGAEVATISYTTEPSWSVGQITLPAGLSFSEGNNGRLELGNGNVPVVREVIVDIAQSFSEGDIVINIGNLTKNIRVRRMTALSSLGGICEDFASEFYKTAEVINPSEATSWVKLSDRREPQGGSSLLDKIHAPNGAIYVHFAGNVGFENAASPREAQLYIAGEKGKQRSRVLVQQNAYEIYGDIKNRQIENSYVGTFHRWNQTAERIIRMDASAYNIDGYQWTATVVSGNDFIVLSTEPSKDSNIYPDDPFGARTTIPQYATDEEIEAHCQVDGNATTVNGTGRYIYFKVGLKSRLASLTSSPRYGLIAVIHAGGNHLIYVRQGEEPDYLMRPWDDWKEGEGGAGSSGRMRNKVAKIVPYNLTDPEKSTSHEVDRGRNGYTFTDYPSQGGYYFMALSTLAYPRQVGGQTTQPSGGTWSQADETCPRGYRRLTDDGGGTIQRSEARLSLWLYPRSGSAGSSITNQYRGYLADGYFDRRKIETIISEPRAGYSRVNGSDVTASAYRGTLFYNPRSLASVFFPESGSYAGRSSGGSGMFAEGYWGGFHTATSRAGTNFWLMNTGLNPIGGSTTQQVCDMYSGGYDVGWSIRCVRDENPPLLTDGEHDVTQFPSGNGEENNLISLEYKENGGSLEEQLLQVNPGGLSIGGTLNLYGNKKLTAADYSYLNSLANNSAYKLEHLILAGAANKILPAQAFTSPNWVSLTFRDADRIEAGAFAFSGLANALQLKNIKFGNYDAIEVASGAFVFPSGYEPATQVNLFLAGVEYRKTNGGKSWNGINWYSIKNYYGKK